MTGRRIVLHVGTPKTGTSYLQDVLFRNQAALARESILYPAERFDEHFLAALDLMRLPWGGLEREAVGAWDRLAETVRRHDGTSIISHEILARASSAQIERALQSLGLGDDDPPEIHVVLSARDIVRQIPAEWQENIKHRRAFSYAHFLELIGDPTRSNTVASWFWGVQEIPWILDRWARDLPPSQVHLITVPPPGGAPDVLWQRFCTAFGLTDLDLDLGEQRTNPSLGVPETALLRRINRRVVQRLPPEYYRPLVRELLAHQTLSQRRSSPRLGLPPDLHAWAQDLSRAWVEEIRPRGYDVVGDLDDLLGRPAVEWVDPDRPRPAAVASASLAAIEVLLLDHARVSEERDRLREELDDTRRALERSYLRPSYRARERIVGRLERARVGRGAMRVYRWLRRGARA